MVRVLVALHHKFRKFILLIIFNYSPACNYYITAVGLSVAYILMSVFKVHFQEVSL